MPLATSAVQHSREIILLYHMQSTTTLAKVIHISISKTASSHIRLQISIIKIALEIITCTQVKLGHDR